MSARASRRLRTSKIRQSRRVLARVSSAAQIVRHCSGGSGGMRISITAAQTGRPAGLSLGGAIFMALGNLLPWTGGEFLDHATASLLAQGGRRASKTVVPHGTDTSLIPAVDEACEHLEVLCTGLCATAYAADAYGRILLLKPMTDVSNVYPGFSGQDMKKPRHHIGAPARARS
jgi:hypothetical protein